MSHPQPTTPAAPSVRVQAAVTVTLGVYLFGLLLTVLGNSSSGSSALVRTLQARLFAPWLAPAWLDLGFDMPLTHGLPEDADHGLEIRRTAGPRDEPLRLPGDRGGERAARWRRLARGIAGGAAGDPATLAAGVGRGAFTVLGGEDVRLRVVRSPLPERGAPAGPATPQQAYAARVRLVEGELQLIATEPRGELAPLAPPGERP